MGNLDQLERRLMHAGFERLVALPVTVRLLDDNAALQQQPLQHLLHVELGVLGVAHAQREGLEIAEQRHIRDLRLSCHGGSPWSLSWPSRHPRRADGAGRRSSDRRVAWRTMS